MRWKVTDTFRFCIGLLAFAQIWYVHISGDIFVWLRVHLSNFSGIAAGAHCTSIVGSKIMVSFLWMAQQSLSHWNSMFRFLGTSLLSWSCLWKRSELICFLRPRYMHITCLFGGYVDKLTHPSAFQSVSTAILLGIFPPRFFGRAISWMWLMWIWPDEAICVGALFKWPH